MERKYSLSGLASNPAMGISNLDLNVVGADGSQGNPESSDGISIKDMLVILDKFENSNSQNINDIKTDLEEIFPQITREEYRKMVSQLMNSIDYANDPKKRTKNPSTGKYDPTPQELASRMKHKLNHIKDVNSQQSEKVGSTIMAFNSRQAQVKKKKKTRGNPFRVLMGKVGKLLDHGLEKKDIVRYLSKQKYWNGETIERAVDIVRDYNKKIKNDSKDEKDEKPKKASQESNVKVASYDYDTKPDFGKRSTPELISRAYYLDDLLAYNKDTPQGDFKEAASKEGAKEELAKVKTELKNRGMDLKNLDLG
jgi:hypothetical protein